MLLLHEKTKTLKWKRWWLLLKSTLTLWLCAAKVISLNQLLYHVANIAVTHCFELLSFFYIYFYTANDKNYSYTQETDAFCHCTMTGPLVSRRGQRCLTTASNFMSYSPKKYEIDYKTVTSAGDWNMRVVPTKEWRFDRGFDAMTMTATSSSTSWSFCNATLTCCRCDAFVDPCN